MFEAPYEVTRVKDIKYLYDLADSVDLVDVVYSVSNDMFTSTATMRGIEMREKIYGINPKDTDTLEERRFRVQTRENEKTPYSIRAFENKLKALCGTNGYSVTLGTESIDVKVELVSKAMLTEVTKLMEALVPVNMLISADLKYNTHSVLASFTHAQLAAYTHKQLQDEVIK